MTDTPTPEAGSEVASVPPDATPTGRQATSSDTIIIRQMTDEQLVHYHETGDLPASVDIPLVKVSDFSSQQPDGGTMPFNGFRKK